MASPVLVLDTIGPWCAAALQIGEAVVEDSREIGRGHAEVLAPMVEGLFEAGDIAPRDLHRIGVNCGPGGFAGTRVGVAFARGLALASGAQAVGIGALPALARNVDPDGSRTVLVIHDAKRGDFLWSVFKAGKAEAGLERGDAAQVQAVVNANRDAYLTGSGAVALGLEDAQFDPRPPLRALLDLTQLMPASAPPPSPIYARAPDAKPAAS